jgi:hypothetical protein
MIRIVDEPIFSLTQTEYAQLQQQYWQAVQYQDMRYRPTFEQFLLQQYRPYTTYREENP